MEIRVERKDFLASLIIGASLAGRSKVLPVLDNVKIRVKDNNLMFISMDGDSAIQKRTGLISGSEDGEFAVNATDLIRAFKALKDDEVTLVYTKDENTLEIKHNKGKLSLSAITTEDFPTIGKGENGTTFSMNSELFFSWLSSAKSFVATDNVRPIMCGMYIDVRNGIASCCASDGMKMFTDSAAVDGTATDTQTVIPSTILGVMQSVVNGTLTCSITIDSLHTTISVDGAKLSTRNLDGRYPNFRGVIPTKQDIEVVVDKNEFVGGVSRVSICSSSTSLVKLEVSGSNVSMEANNMEFGKSAKEDIFCNHNGNDITIGFKHDSMLNLLANIDSDKATLLMSTPERAIVIKDDAFPNKVLLVMPCLLS